MSSLISNYFSFRRLRDQFKNRHLSWLMIYDRDSHISFKSRIQRFVILRKTIIGDYSYVGYSSNFNRVTIGKFCSISKHVCIGLTHHPSNFISTSPIFFSALNGTGYKWIDKDIYDENPDPVTIGNDVWIAMNATIVGGVTVGNGAIIAAHSVVTKDVPPYAIVGGIPAKVIKYRFEDHIIKKLEESQWWNLPDEELKNKIKQFQIDISHKPDDFFDDLAKK
jgi:acetyltransferase-like isoleucine patch superfamily enzyme